MSKEKKLPKAKANKTGFGYGGWGGPGVWGGHRAKPQEPPPEPTPAKSED
jgi:hypothetical protein